MNTPHSTTRPVLVVGATGALGGQVVDELLRRGKNVRALVRPSSDASGLQRKGVEIARGDMLDPDSLTTAMDGADAVVTTAAGYTRGDKKARDIDTTGNTNLADAAHRSGIRRFVLTSILTSDQTPDVPHFWHKKLAEDRLEQLGVPFVALRPGAFLDQIASMTGNPLDKGRLLWMGKKTVPLTFVLTSDLAVYLAAAVDADVKDAERVDIGWDRPLGIGEVGDIMGTRAGKAIKVRGVPSALTRVAGAVVGPFVPMVKDMAAMFRWFDGGGYVADTTRQTQLFGPAPTAEDAIARLTAELSAPRRP
ncbi:SDR family oxidoreductase [Streptomyces sp. NPDC093085]|uniref:SDR family oxidoreductase n=1 Tax=Streptomyces sp. NPDC093085 TaxID=3155068 RepID=UPI0034380EBE